MKILSEDRIRQELIDSCKGKTQKERAAELGLSQQYLTDLIHGKRQISDTIAELLGYNRHIVFIEKESNDGK
jgi:plasmid maintenance system antidote protein VapI